MTGIHEQLIRLEENIKIGIIGIGSIGNGMFYQSNMTPGIECIAIADVILEKAIKAAERMQRDYKVVSSVTELNQTVEQGKLAICESGDLLTECTAMDLLVEASNAITAGGEYALKAIDNGKHIVMMNAEADLIFGPYLLKCANQNNVVYTSADGDQPAVIARMVNDIRFWGFQLVLAGNIKGYMDRYVDPTIIIPEADKRNLDYKMCSSYTDGTKLYIEMALVANGLGCHVTIPGLHGPRIKEIYEIFDHLDLESIWEDRIPKVEYVLGAKPKGGVFAIGYTDDPFQQYTLDWFPPDMGKAPFSLFYRPYHLGHIESMACIAEAALNDQAVLKPTYGFQTNVYTYSKKDLKKGDTLDGIGGYACYGILEDVNHGEPDPGLPICLAEGLTVQRDIPKDEKIKMSDVTYNHQDRSFELFELAMQTSRQFAAADV